MMEKTNIVNRRNNNSNTIIKIMLTMQCLFVTPVQPTAHSSWQHTGDPCSFDCWVIFVISVLSLFLLFVSVLIIICLYFDCYLFFDVYFFSTFVLIMVCLFFFLIYLSFHYLFVIIHIFFLVFFIICLLFFHFLYILFFKICFSIIVLVLS